MQYVSPSEKQHSGHEEGLREAETLTKSVLMSNIARKIYLKIYKH